MSSLTGVLAATFLKFASARHPIRQICMLQTIWRAVVDDSLKVTSDNGIFRTTAVREDVVVGYAHLDSVSTFRQVLSAFVGDSTYPLGERLFLNLI